MDDFHKGEIKNWLEKYNGDDEDDESDSPFFPDVSSDEESDSDIDVDDDELDEYYEIPCEVVQELESDEEAEGGIMDINEEEGEDEEEDVNTDIVEEESEPEDLMKMVFLCLLLQLSSIIFFEKIMLDSHQHQR